MAERADKIMLGSEARDLIAPLQPGWEKWLEPRRGDFSRLVDRTGKPMLIYDPATTRSEGPGTSRLWRSGGLSIC